MNEGELDTALAELVEAVERVREQIAHPPYVLTAGAGTKPLEDESIPDVPCELEFSGEAIVHHVSSNDFLHFKEGMEVVEVERFMRIIYNAAQAAERISRIADIAYPAYSSATERYVSVLRDSLADMARLIGAKNYVKRTPDWLELADAEQEKDRDLKLAEAYSRLKEVRDSVPAIPPDIEEKITKTMNKISEER
jgi:hypothetical protein